jgi:hypothetical protein
MSERKTSPQPVAKKPYVPPEVVKHGTVKELTKGTGSTATESHSHTAKKAGRK